MKLLIVTQKVDSNDQNLGFFHAWIREFAKHAEELSVICLEEGAHDLPAKVRILSLGKERQKSRIQYVWRFYKYIWRERHSYDAVFVHMNPEYVVLGGPLWRILGKKIALWYTHKSVDLKLRLAELMADRVFTASRESFRLKSRKVMVTGHGIDTDYFVPKYGQVSSDITKIVTAGRVAPVKHIDVIIKSVKELVDENIDVELAIIGAPVQSGDDAYERYLEHYAEHRQNNAEGEILPLLTKEAFFKEWQEKKWTGVKRCC
jgi:glycosyltransferase involved in cell wall biosynthesis